MFFNLLYFILALLLYIVALPLLLLLPLKSKYKYSIPARFFLKDNRPFNRDGIWFHSCSLGETQALKPIIEMLNNSNINISTITTTGFEAAKKYERQNNVEVRYLPFEIFLPFWIRKNSVLVVLEAEFWYLLFLSAFYHDTKIILLNARLSKKSFPKYMKLKWFYSRMLSIVDTVYVQSEDDKQRFLDLSNNKIKTISVIGNIKLAQEIKITQSYKKPQNEVIVAASTHKGEEKVIIEAFLNYNTQNDSKLIIVPRHPERFDDVYTMVKTYHDKATRFSEVKNFDSKIVVVDMMGELNNIYAISDIAIIGGAFDSIKDGIKAVGGHNPLEPAKFGCKIITGESYFLQEELFKYVKNVTFTSIDTLEKILYEMKNKEMSFVEEKIDIKQIVNRLKDIG